MIFLHGRLDLRSRGEAAGAIDDRSDTVPPPFRNRERDAQSVVALTDCLARVRVDAAADLFVKIQEFLEPRLKTKPKPVDAGLIRQVPLSPKRMSDKSTYNSENFPAATNYIAVANFY